MGIVNNMVSCNGAVTKIGFSKQENRVFKGNKYISEFLRIGYTAEYELDLTELVASGQLTLGNTSTTASILLGFATGVYPVEIKPGGTCLIPLAEATDTIYMKSSVEDRVIGSFVPSSSIGNVNVGNDHGLSIGRIVRFTTTGTLPAGLATETDYYVISAFPDSVGVSAFPNGTLVEITDNGTGTHTATEVYPCYTTMLANQA